MGLWDEPQVDGARAARPPAPRVFLAYAPTEHQFAYTLTGDLRQRGVNIEGDPVGAKSSVLPRLAQTAAAPEWLVVVLSPSALWSPLIGQEMRIAGELIQRRRLCGVLAIIATPVPPTDIPSNWPITHGFDATRDYLDALRQLCAAMGMAADGSRSQIRAPTPAPAPPDPARQETELIPVAPDPAREETTLLPVASAPVAHDLSRQETTLLPSAAPSQASPGGRAPSAARSGASSRAGAGVRSGAASGRPADRVTSAKGVSRRRLIEAGFWVAAAAVAGGSLYIWKTAPGPLPSAPGPNIRWRYLINSNATTAALEANGVVYVGTADGHFYALDAASHRLRWAYDAQAAIRPEDPVAEKGAVYFCAVDGSVYKLADDTTITSDEQRLRWRFQKTGKPMLSPALGGGVLYVACKYYRLYALDSQKGSVVWTAAPPFNPTSPPTLDDGRLYVAGLNSAFALASGSSEQLWKTPVGGPISSRMPLSHGTLYACLQAETAFAFDAATGKLRWRFTTDGDLYVAPVVDDARGAVYLGDGSGLLYALDARTGKLRWRQKLDSAVVSPKLINGRLYAASSNGYLYAVDTDTGFIHWQAVVGQGVVSPLGAGDDTLYVGGADGYLYAIDAS